MCVKTVGAGSPCPVFTRNVAAHHTRKSPFCQPATLEYLKKITYSLLVMEAWQQDMQNSIRSLEDLQERFSFSVKEEVVKAIASHPLLITEHTASLIDWSNEHDPLLKMSLPTSLEHNSVSSEMEDPIGDGEHSPVPFLTHRYEDRVLIHATTACAQNCRFCFRRCRKKEAVLKPENMHQIVAYLESQPQVTEAIFSGGDPWMLTDELLHDLLKHITAIDHIKQVRFHTRLPIVLPSRITPSLLALLATQKETHEVSVVVHLNHKAELDKSVIAALKDLQQVVSEVKVQTVLLKGVNDSLGDLSGLYQTLHKINIPPYYLHQLDLAKHTNHFRAPIKKGKILMMELKTKHPNLPLPTYVLDIPGGGGKIPILSQQVKEVTDGTFHLTDRFGNTHLYTEPTCE